MYLGVSLDNVFEHVFNVDQSRFETSSSLFKIVHLKRSAVIRERVTSILLVTYIRGVTTINGVQVTKTRSRDVGRRSRVSARLAFLSIVRGTRCVSSVGGILIGLGTKDSLILHEFL